MNLIKRKDPIKQFLLTAILLFTFIICVEAQAKVDHLSLVTTPIKLLRGDTIVAQGTGFYFITIDTIKKQSIVFLVTNYHVLTGAPPIQKRIPLGNNIIFYFHKTDKNPALVKAVRLPLYTKKKNQFGCLVKIIRMQT